MTGQQIAIENLLPLLRKKLRQRVNHLSDALPDEHLNQGVLELYRELDALSEASHEVVERTVTRVVERIRKRVRDERERGVRVWPAGSAIEDLRLLRDTERDLEARDHVPAVLEVLQTIPDGDLLFSHRVDGRPYEALAREANPPTSVRTIQRRIQAAHEMLMKRLGGQGAFCIAFALLLFDEPLALAPPPDSRPQRPNDIPTRPPAPSRLGWPLAIGFGALFAFLSWFGLRSCESDTPAPGSSANPASVAKRPLPGEPLMPDEPAVAPLGEPERAPYVENAVAAAATARHKARRAARPLGKLAERCFPGLQEPGAILERVQVATMLLEWAPPTAQELTLLASLRELGPSWRFQDIEPPARSAAELATLLDDPPTSGSADCETIGRAAIYIGAIRRVFTGEDGGCFGRPDQPACQVAPDAPINAAALVTVTCRALFNNPEAPPSELASGGECHPALARIVPDAEPAGWPSNLWYSGPPRVLLASFPEVRPSLLEWLELHGPEGVVSAGDADALFDLLPH